MTQELICERHGPYSASLGSCPCCAQEAGYPAGPAPLDDELPTDPWGGRQPQQQGPPSDDETIPPGGDWSSGADDDVTEWPSRRQDRFPDDEDVTDWPAPGGRPGRWEDDETVVERAEKGMLGYLIVQEGMRRGQVHRIRNGTVVGRGDADIPVRDQKVSRNHAKFTVEEDQFLVWDFGSANGTYVNGTRIREATPLHENDIIKIGDTPFVLKVLE